MNELADLMYEFCMRSGTIEMGQHPTTGAFEYRMVTKIGGEQKGSLMRVTPQEKVQLDAILRHMLWQFNLEWTRQKIKEGAEVVDAWPEWKKNCLTNGTPKENAE